MLSASELRLLDAVLHGLLPVEDGAAMREFVHSRAAIQPDTYRAGLILLEGFEDLGPTERTARLQGLEGHPSISLMVQHAVEGYYTSAAGFADVGFRVTA